MRLVQSDLSAYRVLLTGASGGIGMAIARELARHSAHIATSARNETKLHEATQTIAAAHPAARLSPLPCDLSDPAAATALPARAATALGGLDCVINNAGLALQLPVPDTTTDIWDQLMAVNARAPFLICRESLPFLMKSANPRVISISSVVGHRAYENQSAYAASKHALEGFSKVFAREAHGLGIAVHLIAPGGVNTPMVREMRPDIDSSDLIDPAEIADLVIFLLSRRGKGSIDQIDIRRSGKAPWG